MACAPFLDERDGKKLWAMLLDGVPDLELDHRLEAYATLLPRQFAADFIE